jgi:hypothetical protein
MSKPSKDWFWDDCIGKCRYCGADAVTYCSECDADLCDDCNANPNPLNESICEPCLEELECIEKT